MKAALEFLNMPGIRFALKHTRGPLSSHGQDTVEFLISTNPGEEPKPLAKIASGGELSRIMLAFKSALADRDALPTVIYDEIDTGVSGLAAGRIGQLLHQTARGHQVLCITHTPQVAAFADNQLLIQKNVRKDRTFTEIHTLDMDGRVEVLPHIGSTAMAVGDVFEVHSPGGGGFGGGQQLGQRGFLGRIQLERLGHSINLFAGLFGVDVVEHGRRPALNAHGAHALQHAIDQLGLVGADARDLAHLLVHLAHRELAHGGHRHQQHQHAAKAQAQPAGNRQGFE